MFNMNSSKRLSDFISVFVCVSGVGSSWLGGLFVCVRVLGSVRCGYRESVEII